MPFVVRRLAALAAPVLLSACAAPMASTGAPATAEAGKPVEVGIIAINDFHGMLEPPHASVSAPDGHGGTVQVPAGGAAWLASAVRALQAKYPNHLTVSAGDLTSASQFASSIYLDEPAVGVANRLGLDFNAVGNHEFDRGVNELERLQHGGCAHYTSRQPCQVEQFTGAKYEYLAANVTEADGRTIFPATAIRSFGTGARKVSVGVIGLTLRGTRDLVSPGGIQGVTFGDEADAINRGVATLKGEGADAVVVLIHQGLNPKPGSTPDPNGCDVSGDLEPILARLDPRVDVVVSAHTHQTYNCMWPGRTGGQPMLLTSAGSYGRLVTDITLDIDPASGAVVSKHAKNLIVQSEGYTSSKGPVTTTSAYPTYQPAPDIAAYVGTYVAAAKAFAQRVSGHLSGPAGKGGVGGATAPVGGNLGHLIADAQLSATRKAGAGIAFMNPFGIRAELVPGEGGAVTYSQIYQVQPFNNELVTLTLTGAQIKAALEQGFDDTGVKQALSPSAGFAYAVDMKRPSGDRVTSITLDGKPLDMDRNYRVTMSNFLSGGGDGFSEFTKGIERTVGATDIDALEQWLTSVPLRQVPAEARETFAP
ncbi:MAG: bifunctional metallophosphatase/5'-nucleotidase [Sphingomonadales bacterium]|nr:bifunctional metallophosphatase/5'-nucleotidase [Sphingomonadales bacterium]MDE2570017.1 bifunctional metallophosphatase/5'-nucleotidase [Sphingomonadales bacterium]